MTLMNIISAAKTTPTFVVLMRYYAQSAVATDDEGVGREQRVPIDVIKLT